MSATTISPIPTKYNGVSFRSRVEARWAVFFDTMGIRWEYEREAYDTPDGAYLPDFWLPDVLWLANADWDDYYRRGVWCEVKGAYPRDAELRKAEHVAVLTSHPMAVVVGPPNDGTIYSLIGQEWVGDCSDCPCDLKAGRVSYEGGFSFLRCDTCLSSYITRTYALGLPFVKQLVWNAQSRDCSNAQTGRFRGEQCANWDETETKASKAARAFSFWSPP